MKKKRLWFANYHAIMAQQFRSNGALSVSWYGIVYIHGREEKCLLKTMYQIFGWAINKLFLRNFTCIICSRDAFGIDSLRLNLTTVVLFFEQGAQARSTVHSLHDSPSTICSKTNSEQCILKLHCTYRYYFE